MGKIGKALELEEGMLKKIVADTKPLQNGSKIAFRDHPQKNIYETPVPLIEEPPKVRKNNGGLFETPIAPGIDEEIKRLKCNGLDSRQISAELAKQGTMITWQRVRKRFAFIARKMPKEVPQSAVTEPRSPGLQRSYPAKMPVLLKQAESLGLSSDLAERIIVLNGQKLSPHSISDALEEESGTILSESQIMEVIVSKARGEI
jgi:hypothetical protein